VARAASSDLATMRSGPYEERHGSDLQIRVAEVEVAASRIVVVDCLLQERQSQNACIEIDRILRMGRHGAEVMKSR
jgi:hypothetical protein